MPRVFEKVYNSAEQKAEADGKGKIFRAAADTADRLERGGRHGGAGPLLRLKHAVFDRLVYGKLRAALGGQVEYAVSGGAPLGARLGHFFRGIGLIVLEGYGLTETTAPSTVNRPAALKIGTVGQPLPGVTVRIADDGEILVKGDHVFAATGTTPRRPPRPCADGWFHTGDIGELDDDGFLRITGRKKEILVTAGGKNVAPAVLEDRLRAHPLVSQCIVVGDQKPFIAALVTLDAEMLPTWLANNGKPAMDVAAAAADPDVRAAIQAAVDDANKAVSKAEAIRKFDILADDFTEDNGYLTPVAEAQAQRRDEGLRRRGRGALLLSRWDRCEPAAARTAVGRARWPLVWLAMAAAITWSVVRFELLIVAVLTVTARAARTARHRAQPAWICRGRWTVPAAARRCRDRRRGRAELHLRPGLDPSRRSWTSSPSPRSSPQSPGPPASARGGWCPWIALAGYVVAGAWIIRADPSPRIDVWVILQQASDGWRHGTNAYAMTWQHSPGVTDAFTYLPWTLVLLAPGRWLSGDVRWALLAWTLVGAAWRSLALGRWRSQAGLGRRRPARPRRRARRPRWSRPGPSRCCSPCSRLWALLVSRDRAWWAVHPARARAGQQAAHRAPAAAAGALAAVSAGGARRPRPGWPAALVLPWFLASPARLPARHGDRAACTSGRSGPPTRSTWRRSTSCTATPPFWLTGLVVLAVAGAGRPGRSTAASPDLGQLLRWFALVLLVANLVNKQAFYNQFWLVAALVLVSLAVPAGASLPGQRGEVAEPAPGEAGLGHRRARRGKPRWWRRPVTRRR